MNEMTNIERLWRGNLSPEVKERAARFALHLHEQEEQSAQVIREEIGSREDQGS